VDGEELAGAFLTLNARHGTAADTEGKTEAGRIEGRELFTREWIPGDKRSH
jgi:hypothetical protein